MVLFDGQPAPDRQQRVLARRPDGAQAGFKIPYPKGGVPSVDAKIDECSELTDSARIACWIELDKQLTEEVVPWVPYMFGANTDLIGPAVTKWDFDQFSGEAAYAHVAVDPSKQK